MAGWSKRGPCTMACFSLLLLEPGLARNPTLSGSVDATAYAVRTATGGLSLMVVNKDALQNLILTIETNQSIQTATLQAMTGPSLAATSGGYHPERDREPGR